MGPNEESIMEKSNQKLTGALVWKLLERFGVQGSQFVLQIILARILSPEHYGVLSLMVVFTTLANVFIQSGFNTALIQNKDVTEEELEVFHRVLDKMLEKSKSIVYGEENQNENGI